jgi:hypothetical protein
MLEWTLALLLVGGNPTSPPSTPLRPGISRELADSLRAKILELERRGRLPRDTKAPRPAPMVVTQGELNSYINLVLKPRLPAGLSDVDFAFTRGIAVRGLVDLDQVKAAMQATSAWNPLGLLSGSVPIELSGQLKNDAGFGTFELEEIRLGPAMLPPTLLHQMVASATRTPQNPQGFDILAPFRLPYGLKRVRIQAGRAQLEW